ncbi:MAG: ribonuclease P protein component [Lentisphaerae bacterium]|nr:MAG: ribonuclease P protein component [Lentisphaerota bacterium]
MTGDAENGKRFTETSRETASLKGHIPLRKKEFQYVKEHGHRIIGRRVVLCLCPAPDAKTRLGIVAGRRYHRQAVKRNRARRLIRETFRRIRHRLTPPLWLVVIARARLLSAKQSELQDEMLALLRKYCELQEMDPNT